jgi:hypothetical protein
MLFNRHRIAFETFFLAVNNFGAQEGQDKMLRASQQKAKESQSTEKRTWPKPDSHVCTIRLKKHTVSDIRKTK